VKKSPLGERTATTVGSLIYFNRPEAELLENWQGFGAMIDK